MKEQFQNAAAATPAKAKSVWLKMVIINMIVSALVSLIIFFLVVGSLGNRVSVLEQQMAKQMNAYKVK
ncbi:MAG: hypothetical protein PHO56_04855 [Patescibacteria group bacterium]|nr:hypothetical protein [Patescibacteria group bacterium]